MLRIIIMQYKSSKSNADLQVNVKRKVSVCCLSPIARLDVSENNVVRNGTIKRQTLCRNLSAIFVMST